MLEPIAKAILRAILATPCVQTDDTGLLIQVVEDGKAKKGYIWTYTTKDCLVYYQLTTGRGGDGPQEILGNYRGFVQADGLASYDALFRQGNAVEVGCWAHARRKFVEAFDSEGVRAPLMVDKIRDLYLIEREAKHAGLSPMQNLALRQERAKPILRDIEAILRDWNPKNDPPIVLPKSPLGVAVTYALNQWQALCRYAEDGRLDIDNNRSERMLRHVAIGRKNWQSVGCELTGQEAANIMTVVMTCRALDIDPQIYLTRTLQDLARSDGSLAQVEQWTPMRWKERGLDLAVIEEHRDHIGKVLANAVANAARSGPPPQ
jgi:transposase